MNKIIMNLQYSTSLQCFFATLGQAACAWNHLDVNNHEIYLKTLNHEKATIEYAKKSMKTMKWCSKDCLISLAMSWNKVVDKFDVCQKRHYVK